MKYKRLIVKRSSLPGSGLGLFAGKEIPKAGVVVEYAGRRRKWRLIKDIDGCGSYILGLNRTIVIDAQPRNSGLGRYANDAAGLRRVRGFRNNSEYVIRGGKVFIESTRRIKKGEEILVGYGRAYWKQAEKNITSKRKWKTASSPSN
jgi:SET domain-containing protein